MDAAKVWQLWAAMRAKAPLVQVRVWAVGAGGGGGRERGCAGCRGARALRGRQRRRRLWLRESGALSLSPRLARILALTTASSLPPHNLTHLARPYTRSASPSEKGHCV